MERAKTWRASPPVIFYRRYRSDAMEVIQIKADLYELSPLFFLEQTNIFGFKCLIAHTHWHFTNLWIEMHTGA
jgi:hypothetical protein